MKRIGQIAVTVILMILIPSGFISAQEKKEQKQIKVIVSEKDGKQNIVIDTTFTGDVKMDSIKLKDGKVIFIGDHKSHMTGLAEVSEKGDKIFVTVTTGEDGKNKEVKVVKGEPIMIMDGDGGENVVVVKKGTHMIEGEGGKVMVWSSASSGEKDNVIYIQKGKADVKDGEKKINVEIREDGSGNKVEKTNYVIARDGMVVTIEGDNEEKVKELAGVIESKMGISEKNNKQVVKEETKKTIRK